MVQKELCQLSPFAVVRQYYLQCVLQKLYIHHFGYKKQTKKNIMHHAFGLQIHNIPYGQLKECCLFFCGGRVQILCWCKGKVENVTWASFAVLHTLLLRSKLRLVCLHKLPFITDNFVNLFYVKFFSHVWFGNLYCNQNNNVQGPINMGSLLQKYETTV